VIKEFVQIWDKKKDDLQLSFMEKHPNGYEDIVKQVIELIGSDDHGILGYGGQPDPDCIHVINDGDYQGTLLFVIAAKGYQPSTYWYVKVGYGSCSGCDTYQSIRDSGGWNDTPTEEQVRDYMTLALHIIQELKLMD
jgi:hypothetical protein